MFVRRSRFLAIALPLLLGAVPGCSPGDSSHGQGHDHAGHDHVGHHAPEHKPKDFAEAVLQVRRRAGRVEAIAAHGDADRLNHELDHLRELIGWLPELAADSDLRKPEWDRVHRLTEELQRTCESVADASAAGRSPVEPAAKIEALTRQLGEFVALADTPPE
jgi:hypothetical protein